MRSFALSLLDLALELWIKCAAPGIEPNSRLKVMSGTIDSKRGIATIHFKWEKKEDAQD